MKPEEILHIIEHNPIIKDLNLEDKEKIINVSTLRILQDGEVLYRPTDTCSKLTFLFSGRLKVVKILPSGKEIVVDILSAGVLFGEACAFIGEKYPAWISAAGEAKVLEIPLDSVLEFAAKREFLLPLLAEMARKSFILQRKIELFSLRTVKEKVAFYLLSLSEKQGSMHLVLDTSKTLLAKEIGSCREAVSRTFHLLESDGIIRSEGPRKVEIIDPVRFSQIFEFRD